MDALHAGMAAHALGVRSTVRLLCNTAAISEHLPPLLGPFLAAHPQLDVELRELDSLDVLFALRRQRADLGIVADYVATEGLSTRPWCEDRLVAVAPAALARGLPRTLTFAGLLELPFVGLPEEAGLSRFLQARALRHGRDLHHRVRVQGFDALTRLVADGVGVAVVPALTAERLAGPRVRVRPLDDAWATRRLLVCFGAPETLAPGAAALLEALAPR
jgi:DNA-binding transcriptional LysR family regulator